MTRLQAAAADLVVNDLELIMQANAALTQQLTATACVINLRKAKFKLFVLGMMFKYNIITILIDGDCNILAVSQSFRKLNINNINISAIGRYWIHCVTLHDKFNSDKTATFSVNNGDKMMN